MNKPLVLLAALTLAGPTVALAQAGSPWVDPPKSIEPPAAAPSPAVAEPVKSTPAASRPAPPQVERLREPRIDRKAKLAARSKPRPVRVARARPKGHLLARLFGPGRRGPIVINSSHAAN